MDHEARRDTLYARLFLHHERKKGRSSTARQSSGGGSRNVANAGCYWLASGFIVPWRSCPIHGTDMGLQGRLSAKDRREPETEGAVAEQARLVRE